MFSFLRPRLTNKSKQAIAAAPAPEATNLTLSSVLPNNLRPFKTAAEVIIAVPCWSSWKTGILTRSLRVFSI